MAIFCRQPPPHIPADDIIQKAKHHQSVHSHGDFDADSSELHARPAEFYLSKQSLDTRDHRSHNIP